MPIMGARFGVKRGVCKVSDTPNTDFQDTGVAATRLDKEPPPCMNLLQGGTRFSGGNSAKLIFNVEIEKLRAEVFFPCGEDQNLVKLIFPMNILGVLETII
jgi:hypothetical protein